MVMGRPSLKTPELIETMLLRLVESDEGLEGVCKADDMPAFQTVYRWLDEDEAFQEAYARARRQIADVQAFRGLRDAVKCEDAAKARVALDARKWLAAKLDSKKYGDSTTLKGDPDNPIELAVHEVRRTVIDGRQDA
jgi:hypothetical protein